MGDIEEQVPNVGNQIRGKIDLFNMSFRRGVQDNRFRDVQVGCVATLQEDSDSILLPELGKLSDFDV